MQTEIRFNCRNCRHFISSRIEFAGPDYDVEEIRDSAVNSEDHVVCPNCNEDHEINIWNGFQGLNLEIQGIDADGIDYDFPIDPEDIPE